MGYKLKAKETIEQGIRRVIVDEIDEALRALTRGPRLTAVHTARTSVKKIRGALRLARAGLDRRTFTRENQSFRDVGHRLGAVRDAEVLLQSWRTMKRELGAPALRGAVAAVERHVTRERRATLRRLLRDGRLIEQTVTALRAARVRAKHLHVRGNQWSALKPGFERVYAQGRERFAAASDDPQGERMHLWRKRVKDLMAQMLLLRGLWPSLLKAWADDSHALADILGDDHDLVVLRVVISRDLRDAVGVADRNALLRAIDRRRARLVDEARPLGRRLYAESPRELADRWGTYWHVWRHAAREQKRNNKATPGVRKASGRSG
jgi:CHAD domain-containing protein